MSLLDVFSWSFVSPAFGFTRLLPSFVPSAVSPGKLGLDSSDVAATQALHTFCSPALTQSFYSALWVLLHCLKK